LSHWISKIHIEKKIIKAKKDKIPCFLDFIKINRIKNGAHIYDVKKIDPQKASRSRLRDVNLYSVFFSPYNRKNTLSKSMFTEKNALIVILAMDTNKGLTAYIRLKK
jgi:hypothetical protein